VVSFVWSVSLKQVLLCALRYGSGGQAFLELHRQQEPSTAQACLLCPFGVSAALRCLPAKPKKKHKCASTALTGEQDKAVVRVAQLQGQQATPQAVCTFPSQRQAGHQNLPWQ